MIRLVILPQHWALLLIGLLVSSGVPAHAGLEISVGPDESWPVSPDLVLAHPLTPSLFADDTSGDDDGSLAQTFQIFDSPFFLSSLFIRYANGGDTIGEMPATLTIFTVPDVNAASLAEPPPGPGTTLLSELVTFPEALPSSTNRVAHIFLEDLLQLPVNDGATGYAIHVTGNGQFQWYRTGATAANVYPFGRAYEDGEHKQSGERDFTLALVSFPAGSDGDVNLDGVVDLMDFGIIRDNFRTGTTREQGNLDRRGTTDIPDFRIWKKQLFDAHAAVPEPATWLLAAGAWTVGPFLLASRRRRTK